MSLCVFFNFAVAAVFAKAVLSLLTVFVFIAKPRNSCKLLLNYRGGSFCEIPLQKKDTAIANSVIQSISN
jgi:hypothetical protein